MKQDNIILLIVAVALVAVIVWETRRVPQTMLAGDMPNDPATPAPVMASDLGKSGLTYLVSNAPYGMAAENPIMPYATASGTTPNGNQVTRFGGRFG